MENITFTATFTFSKQAIIGFADFLGYKPTVGGYVDFTQTPSAQIPVSPNPESAFDFVARLAKEHNEKFVTRWANILVKQEVQKQIDVIQPQVEAQILQPVKDAITVTYE